MDSKAQSLKYKSIFLNLILHELCVCLSEYCIVQCTTIGKKSIPSCPWKELNLIFEQKASQEVASFTNIDKRRYTVSEHVSNNLWLPK